MKPPGFLVPTGSPLEAQIAVRCDDTHEHVATMGRYTKAAGEWPEKLGRVMVKATVQAVVQDSELGRKA